MMHNDLNSSTPNYSHIKHNFYERSLHLIISAITSGKTMTLYLLLLLPLLPIPLLILFLFLLRTFPLALARSPDWVLLPSSASAPILPTPFSAPPGFPGGPLASSEFSSSGVRLSSSGFISSAVSGQGGGLSVSVISSAFWSQPISSVLSGPQSSYPHAVVSGMRSSSSLVSVLSGFPSVPVHPSYQSASGQDSQSAPQPSGLWFSAGFLWFVCSSLCASGFGIFSFRRFLWFSGVSEYSFSYSRCSSGFSFLFLTPLKG